MKTGGPVCVYVIGAALLPCPLQNSPGSAAGVLVERVSALRSRLTDLLGRCNRSERVKSP